MKTTAPFAFLNSGSNNGSTINPAELGAAAAAVAVVEIKKRAAGNGGSAVAVPLDSAEVMHALGNHGHFPSTLSRSPVCYFDHEIWALGTFEGLAARLADALADGSSAATTTIGAADDPVVRTAQCVSCGRTRSVYRRVSRHERSPAQCDACNKPLEPVAFHVTGALPVSELPGGRLDSLDPVEGDVFVLARSDGKTERFRVGAVDEAIHVAVVGCGNIGSHLVGLVSRWPELQRLTLIDPDVYEHRNLISQAIEPGDLGRAKVDVLADRVARLRSDVDVRVHPVAVEEVPYGLFAGATVASCLDNRGARRELQQRCWRVGAPMVDAAVDADSLLFRVGVFAPSDAGACFECSWDEADYAAIDAQTACDRVAEIDAADAQTSQ